MRSQATMVGDHACHGMLHVWVTLLLTIVTATSNVGCGVYSVHSTAVSCVLTEGSDLDFANSSGIAHGLRGGGRL